jgi:hypothetical protein
VLAVVRNLVSCTRLLDTLTVFADDSRLTVEFTIVPGSQYADGVLGFLRTQGVRVLPWEQACGSRYDLAIATSANGELHRLDAPLLQLTHGAGLSKCLPTGSGEPSGLAADQLLHDGSVVAALIGLEHDEQIARLAKYCPPAADRAIVVGDPCRDRLAAGAELRELYRAALGHGPTRKLVLLSSTWGPGSLYESCRELPERLAAQLPADEYRLAAIIHPNATARHGAWEARRLLNRARAAGLLLIPSDAWESAVLAADLLIGDHGSVTLYAVGAGVRAIFGAYDAESIAADSPMAALWPTIPRLNGDQPLEPQIRAALGQPSDGAAYQVTSGLLAMPGSALELIRQAAYGLLRMEPTGPRPRVLAPQPSPVGFARHTAHIVHVDLQPGPGFTLRRFPATVRPELTPDDTGTCSRHLAVETDDLEPALRENADVLLLPRDGDPLPSGERWRARVQAVMDRYPDCTIAATVVAATPNGEPGRCHAFVRDFGPVSLIVDQRQIDPAVLASILLALIQTSEQPQDAVQALRGGISVHVGGIQATVGLSRLE